MADVDLEDIKEFDSKYVKNSNVGINVEKEKAISSINIKDKELVHNNDESCFDDDDDDKNEDYSETAKEIYNFLKSIELEYLAGILYNNGFDDLSLMIDQMKSSSPITNENLKNIGIVKPGHRAKILIKLEEGNK